MYNIQLPREREWKKYLFEILIIYFSSQSNEQKKLEARKRATKWNKIMIWWICSLLAPIISLSLFLARILCTLIMLLFLPVVTGFSFSRTSIFRAGVSQLNHCDYWTKCVALHALFFSLYIDLYCTQYSFSFWFIIWWISVMAEVTYTFFSSSLDINILSWVSAYPLMVELHSFYENIEIV